MQPSSILQLYDIGLNRRHIIIINFLQIYYSWFGYYWFCFFAGLFFNSKLNCL